MKKYLLVFFVLLVFSCNKSSEEVSNLNVSLSLDNKYGTINSVSGYPFHVIVNVTGKQLVNKLYIHLFQKEIQGNSYYYQSSSSVIVNSKTSLPVWAGGINDINKTYEIYAIINDIESYKKTNDVYAVSKLPDYVKNRVTISRIK